MAIELNIANDFSPTPGPRYKEEGIYSGEEFRKNILERKFKEAMDSDEILIVNLDGTQGYGTSFLEESFGGLARKYGIEKVAGRINIISNEESYLKDDVNKYINDANG